MNIMHRFMMDIIERHDLYFSTAEFHSLFTCTNRFMDWSIHKFISVKQQNCDNGVVVMAYGVILWAYGRTIYELSEFVMNRIKNYYKQIDELEFYEKVLRHE